MAASLAACAPLSSPVTSPPRLINLTDAFTAAYDATAAMNGEPRVREMRKRLSATLPGFYSPRSRSEAQFEAQLARSIDGFASIRAEYVRVSREFEAAFDQGQASFRATFTDYALQVPVYLLHSLNEMDGGTRTIDGRTAAIFGADVIARIHSPATLKPFLDHELFHLHHGRFFPECEELWCAAWSEGLAVHVASQMNPGATDEQLMLTMPRPMRAEVMPRLPEAMCLLRANLHSKDEKVYAKFFFGSNKEGPFPPRFGYLLGYLIAQKVGEKRTLSELARMPRGKVESLVAEALASYGACR